MRAKAKFEPVKTKISDPVKSQVNLFTRFEHATKLLTKIHLLQPNMRRNNQEFVTQNQEKSREGFPNLVNILT